MKCQIYNVVGAVIDWLRDWQTEHSDWLCAKCRWMESHMKAARR
jgi:hypothetical protein